MSIAFMFINKMVSSSNLQLSHSSFYHLARLIYLFRDNIWGQLLTNKACKCREHSHFLCCFHLIDFLCCFHLIDTWVSKKLEWLVWCCYLPILMQFNRKKDYLILFCFVLFIPCPCPSHISLSYFILFVTIII